MKIQLKGRRFETIEEIQAESQISRDASRLGSGAGIVVFTPRGTTSRVMDEFNT